MAVIGAGSWGTTVAAIMSEHATTTLWGRNPELVDEIATAAREPATTSRASRCRTRCGPPPHLDAACTGADVVVMAVPSHGYRAVLELAAPRPRRRRPGGQPGQGHRARHAAAHDRGDPRRARRSRPRTGRGADRSEPGARGRRGAAGGVGHRLSRRGHRARAPAAVHEPELPRVHQPRRRRVRGRRRDEERDRDRGRDRGRARATATTRRLR